VLIDENSGETIPAVTRLWTRKSVRQKQESVLSRQTQHNPQLGLTEAGENHHMGDHVDRVCGPTVLVVQLPGSMANAADTFTFIRCLRERPGLRQPPPISLGWPSVDQI